MTQLEYAKKGKLTPQMRAISHIEGLDLEVLRDRVASGTVVIPSNPNHKCARPCAVGEGLRTKVNANIGTSADYMSLRRELKKLNVAVRAGCDTVMDLSTGGDIKRIRRTLLKHSSVPFGTVPIYETAVNVTKDKGHISKMTDDDILSTVESQAKDGVDFMTIHAGVTLETVERLKKEKRLTDVVSRGGALLIEWMSCQKKENPLYENFKEVLRILREYDVTLSLGDGLRPGSLADATDRPQIQELILLGELANQAQDYGVQVMIEGPGHIPINQIEANIMLEKRLCHNAPFYVLGPLVTDVAAGYDHITSAIGGALAASAGADFLCYVTPSEHLALPNFDDVHEGVIAARIAAHAADIAKGVKGAMDWDIKLSSARKVRDWKSQEELAIDPDKAKRYRKRSKYAPDVCTMCSDLCSMKTIDKVILTK